MEGALQRHGFWEVKVWGSLMDLGIDEVMVASANDQKLLLAGPVPSMCPYDLIHSVQQCWEF